MKCPRCHRYLPEGYQFCPYDGTATVERLGIDSARIRAEPTKIHGNILAGRYRIRGFVGKGAMARVYLAEDQQTGAPVAVKVLEEPYWDDADVRERFHREAKMASVIGHPGIVKVFEEGVREEDDAPFLVMEFLLGETVAEYLRREGTMPRQLAISALQQAASALGAAHRAGIVHRDVKADNLFLLGEPGSPYELKVVDFGLSKVPASNLTAAGSVMGTPATMAPEQALGEAIDGRSDVYGLGMVAYRMVAGRAAFEVEDELDLLAHHVWTQVPPPSTYAPDLDPRLEIVIMTCIRKDPDERYATMEALGEELDRISEFGRTTPDPVPPDKPYVARTLVGQLVKASLGRAIDREED